MLRRRDVTHQSVTGFFVASSTALMPTFITVAPGFSHEPRTYSGLPTAAMTTTLRLADDIRYIFRRRVAERHRRVALLQQRGDWRADDARPS